MDAIRRNLIKVLGASATLTLFPAVTQAITGDDRRLLVVLLRGGLDGLHLLPPYAEPEYTRLRGAAAVEDGLRLDGLFALHPAMKQAAALFRDGQLLPVVAVAPPYRERSHFDAQDCLENGTATPHGAKDGWMGRCVAVMPGVGGLAVASIMPLAMRGSERAANWSPPLPTEVDELLLQQLQPLYAADPLLAATFDESLSRASQSGGHAGHLGLPQAIAMAARRMGSAGGPRIGFVEDTGWDSHHGQVPLLSRKLAELDAGIGAAREGFGALWPRTVVMVVTEFGRTARINGTGGTDHGTGGVALMAGGAVRGGHVAGDWPGLAVTALREGRDLQATTDMRSLFKGVVARHLGVREADIEQRIFPGSEGLTAWDGWRA